MVTHGDVKLVIIMSTLHHILHLWGPVELVKAMQSSRWNQPSDGENNIKILPISLDQSGDISSDVWTEHGLKLFLPLSALLAFFNNNTIQGFNIFCTWKLTDAAVPLEEEVLHSLRTLLFRRFIGFV